MSHKERPTFYRQEVNKTIWEVPERYQSLSPVGSGAYGTVWYLVTHLMGADLNNIVKCQKLTDDHVQFLIYQILRGLKDLKPSNLAVNEDCELKILDFGLARHTDDEMTGYVATRWYRAPEIMLNWMHYNQTVKGLILDFGLARHTDDEMTGYVATRWYRAPEIMLNWMHYNQTGSQTNAAASRQSGAVVMSSQGLDVKARNYINSLPHMPKRNFADVFIGANPTAVDLLEKMLVLDTDKRITAAEALAHPYFTQYHDPDDEPEAEPYDQSFESRELEIEEWKTVDLLEKMLVLDTDKRITAAEALAHPYFTQYHDPDDEPEAEPYDQSFESRELEIEEWKRLTYEEVISFEPSPFDADEMES
ncbi:UNVERIFIED_CONTAM: hypothetical protein FKN15_069013 [Acipenser sinensis]